MLSPSPGNPGEGRGEGLLLQANRSQSARDPLPGPLPAYREREQCAVFLTTEAYAPPFASLIDRRFSSLLLLIGPEGGWTEAELAQFRCRNLTGARLTATILRVETAAVAAAAVAAVLLSASPDSSGSAAGSPGMSPTDPHASAPTPSPPSQLP
jgi:hypothetical protein